MILLRIWICLSAALVGLPLNTDGIVTFGRLPGTTCGVLGGEAHLVWHYNDDGDTVHVIRWYRGTEAGSFMGAYLTVTDTFMAFSVYTEKIRFTAPHDVSDFKGAGLTFYGLEASDAGIYTTLFQATNSNTHDVATLEVAEVAGLGMLEICVDGTCNAISDPLTLSASADVKVKFTKGGALTCDMDIDVAPSVGDSFVLVVPKGPEATAEHTLADPATLLAAGSLSIDLAFGKNGEVFHTDTIAAVSVIPGGQSPSPAQAAAIAFGVIFIIAGIILVAVIVFNGLTLPGKVCVGVGVGICVIGCILVVVFVAALTYLTSAEVAGACVAVCVVTVVILIVIVVVWYKMKVI